MDATAIAAIVQLGLQIILELINAKKASGQPLVIEEVAADAGSRP